MKPSRLDLPLAVALDGATHVRIRCTSFRHCGNAAHMLTADLVRRLPNARTLRDFQEKMYCQRCDIRGWSEIEPARRG